VVATACGTRAGARTVGTAPQNAQTLSCDVSEVVDATAVADQMRIIDTLSTTDATVTASMSAPD